MWDRDRAHDVRAGLFGGKHAVRVWNLVESGPALPFTAALACELEAGGSVGPHVQAEFAELVIGLEGQGTAFVDGAPSPLVAGSVVELPLGKALALENGSQSQPLRYLVLKAKPTP